MEIVDRRRTAQKNKLENNKQNNKSNKLQKSVKSILTPPIKKQLKNYQKIQHHYIHPQHQQQLHPNLEHFAALASQQQKVVNKTYSQTVQGIYNSCPSPQVLTSLHPHPVN